VRTHISIKQYARVHHTSLQKACDCSDFQNSCSFIGLRSFWLQWQLPVQAVPALRLLAAKCCSVVCYLRNQPMLTTKYRNHTIQPAQKVNSVLYVTCLCNHTLTHNYWKSTEQSSSKTWYRWNKTRLCALFCVSWIQSFLYLTYLKFILIFYSHLRLRLRLPNRPISFRIFRMTSERISYLPHACYISRPS